VKLKIIFIAISVYFKALNTNLIKEVEDIDFDTQNITIIRPSNKLSLSTKYYDVDV